MADLGDMYESLTLQCSGCDWRPDPDAVMEAVYLHNTVEHDQEEVKLDMVVVCKCGGKMDLIGSTNITDKRIKDHFMCLRDNNTGFVMRNIVEDEDGASH